MAAFQSHISLATCTVTFLVVGCVTPPQPPPATARALAYLEREVPAWKRENGCFSCHNNGDGARALFGAVRVGYSVPESALSDTLAWLARPEGWDKNQGDPGFSDQRLANIQFGVALLAALDAGLLKDPSLLPQAAHRIAADQGNDGAWPIEPGNSAGSPATYGTTLATGMALTVLTRAQTEPAATTKAMAWLASCHPTHVPAAATFLLARPLGSPPPLVAASLEYLRQAQTTDGGWGPYADAPPEPFDTALALLALTEMRDEPGVEMMVQAGRSFLKQAQGAEGSWPATTRPAGGTSYAQHISTTGWATLALLRTDP